MRKNCDMSLYYLKNSSTFIRKSNAEIKIKVIFVTMRHIKHAYICVRWFIVVKRRKSLNNLLYKFKRFLISNIRTNITTSTSYVLKAIQSEDMDGYRLPTNKIKIKAILNKYDVSKNFGQFVSKNWAIRTLVHTFYGNKWY